jgi:hypothetical protein
MNGIIDDTNANSAAIEDAKLDFDIGTGPGCLPSAKLKVGDPGPSGAGGLVFFVSTDGCMGLEAAPIDQGGTDVPWGCDVVNVPGAAGFGIGDGAPNTYDIINADPACIAVGDAAEVARAYTGGTPGDDWYLPSPDELIEMYNTIGQGADGNPGGLAEAMWTSVDASETHAIGVQMNSGNIISEAGGGSQKGFLYRVRAIRTYDLTP